MKTVTKFADLASVPEGQQLKVLSEAVSFEIGLVNTCLDLFNGQYAFGKQFHRIGALSAAPVTAPTTDRIKAFLGQKYTTPSDTPVLSNVAAKVETFFHTNMPEIDLGWTNFFTYHDLRSSNQDSFEIVDTNAGVQFKQRAPGEVVEIRRGISESETTVKAVEFAGGVGILDNWLRFQKWWRIDEVVAEFQAQAWDKMANWHYQLFTAQGAGINVPFDTDDTKTLNNAAGSIFRAVRGRGYAIGQNAGLWIMTSPEQVGRVMKMLEARQGSLIVAYNDDKQPITANIAGVISTTYVSPADTGYYLILPNRKIQRGNWKDLSIKSNVDIYKAAEDLVGRMEFNAAVGDTAQVRRVLWQ